MAPFWSCFWSSGSFLGFLQCLGFVFAMEDPP
jgi:hypothetical protein